jgi:hypothetical protein
LSEPTYRSFFASIKLFWTLLDPHRTSIPK